MATTVSVKVNKGQTYGQALTKAGVGDPTRTNYIFEGWNTKADGTGEMRVSLQQVVKSETIYAQWSAVASFNVNYPAKPANVSSFSIYKNGILQITNPTAAGSFTVDSGDTVYASASASPGYDAPTITGVSTSQSSPTTVTGAISIGLTAGDPLIYTLSFNFDGGSGSPSFKPVEYGSAIGTLPTPTKSGYNFTGWKIGSTTILSSTTWNYTMNQTAVAQWAEIVRTNNFISVGYVSFNVRAVATYNVTSTVTVTLYSSFIGDSSNSTISNGSQNGTQFINGGASDWYVQSVHPSQDDIYYYTY